MKGVRRSEKNELIVFNRCCKRCSAVLPVREEFLKGSRLYNGPR
jgi:hypothetical protein